MMLTLVTKEFEGKCDKAGRPYVFHCLKVMDLLNSTDDELNCIALGHDLIEDCKNVTYADLANMGFSERVIEGIKALTRVPGETEAQYRAKVKLNYAAIQVKMCDLRHNSDITRIKGLTDKDIKRIIKYQEFYTELRRYAPKF